MANKKRHHYIPRFYLKRFSVNNEEKFIGLYNNKSDVFPKTNSFDVYHSIHDSWEEDLTEETLATNTPILLAIERGAFFKLE